MATGSASRLRALRAELARAPLAGYVYAPVVSGDQKRRARQSSSSSSPPAPGSLATPEPFFDRGSNDIWLGASGEGSNLKVVINFLPLCSSPRHR